MDSTRRRWLFRIIWPNVAVAVVFIVVLVQRQIPDTREFLRALGIALVYANLVSLLGLAIVGGLASRYAWHRIPLGPMLLLCVLVIVPAGCLLVQMFLASVGVMRWGSFWPQYIFMLKMCMPLAVVFGLGAFTHSSLRERLQMMEQKLRDQELAEERARKLAAEARLQSLEARIRPHFLFNTLNAISSLIATDPARAEEMVGHLATLLRTSLDASTRPLVPVHEELMIVQSYVDIERARFGNRLRVSFDVPSDLEEANVPPMSVQSLVENAVKHGIAPQPGGGDIRVTVMAENGNLRIQVSDSGSGFDLTVVPPGHGLENLVDRLHALFGDRARLNASRRDGGCVVEIVIPRV